MAGDVTIVFNTEQEDAALRVREGRNVLGDLVPHLAPLAWPLCARLAAVERLPIEVLPFVLSEKGRDVEGVLTHASSTESGPEAMKDKIARLAQAPDSSPRRLNRAIDTTSSLRHA